MVDHELADLGHVARAKAQAGSSPGLTTGRPFQPLELRDAQGPEQRLPGEIGQPFACRPLKHASKQLRTAAAIVPLSTGFTLNWLPKYETIRIRRADHHAFAVRGIAVGP